MPERFDSHMNQSDTTLWRIERDPELRTTIVGIALLDGVPDWDRLRARMDEATWLIPRLRQKVAAAPFGFGPPRWVTDEHFDLDYHLRRIVAPEPGDLLTLLTLAEPAAMAAFDRDRPLWETTLVEGLEGGRSALVQKIHHCVTDGIGAIRMARLLFDGEHGQHVEERAAPPSMANGSARSSSFRLLVDGATDQARQIAGMAGRVAGAMPGVALHVLRDPERAALDGIKATRSVVKLVTPAREPLSPIMRERGMSRRLAAFELSLEELKAAGRVADGTANDAFLAGLTGGMRIYHERHGAPVEMLRVTMPINLRREDDTIGNNRFVPARFALPVDEPDPIVRMQQLGELARSWQHEPGLKYSDVVAGVLNGLPEQLTAAALGSMLKAIDFVATNVPGLETPARLAGIRVEREIALAPTSGSAFSAALLSHVGVCSLGLVMDTAAIPDPDVFADCIRAGFDEVLDVARPTRAAPAGRAKQHRAKQHRAPDGRSSTHPANGTASPAGPFVPTITRAAQWTA